ncbi:inner membrane protein YpjD [Motiliproteus sp. SC1-56]|uniref:cytochrome C assembly family protein n=1 Tax=Motiliproteus sp. SC1-56 TaxID=2799565 RepID=UPI001A8F416B|nr:cytochrome c biogenesis protein CcsA [Motiliproteus sp. SC1-56]
MSLIPLSFISALLYLIGGAAQAVSLTGKGGERRTLVLGAGAAAVLFHTLAVYYVLHPGGGIQLGFFPIASLVAWLVAGLVLISSLKKPLSNLFVAVFPLAAVTVLLAVLAPQTASPKPLSGGMVLHVLSSILAYSIFAIAAFQALLLAAQDRQLKHHHTRGIVRALPPLQVMERLLFEMLWTAMALLSLSLVTGALVIEDLFAQHLVHKTVLSLTAWVIYAIVLYGRHQRGWRGIAAVRWTLGGFVMLMLAFFGSKFMLELVFQTT